MLNQIASKAKQCIAWACLLVSLSVPVSAQDYSAYHAHPYPICFYDTASGSIAESRLLWETYPESLEAVVLVKARRWTKVEIISSRIAIIRTTMNHHRELLNLWPEVACVGETGGDISDRLNRLCREYVTDFIQAEIQHVPFEAANAPICQFFRPE